MIRLYLLIAWFAVSGMTALPLTAQNKKSAATKPRTAQASRTVRSVKRTGANVKGTAGKGQRRTAKTPAVETASIKGLRNERAQIKKQIAAQQQKLRNNERDVKQRLQNLMVINTEIDDKRKRIDTIRRDITTLNGNIGQLNGQLGQLKQELSDRKVKYVKSMRYMHRNRSIQNQLMFVFSAKNFSQMLRRMRFVREYASYQRAQGEAVKVKQAEVTQKHQQLTTVKQQKNTLLYKGEMEKRNLEGKQVEQQNVVSTLQKQQKTIQSIIAKQQQRDAALNAQIDRLIAIEVEKARQRAIEEARRKAAELAAAEKKRKAEELARKKAAAEAAARENARRIAEAKRLEEQRKAEARAAAEAMRQAEERAAANRAAREAREAAREAAERRAAAEAKARQAEAAREAAERQAVAEAKEREREVAEATKAQNAPTVYTLDSEDRRISGSFESNRGRLPMPITGGYKIVSHFGQYNVEGLSNVRLDNKGINILGGAGAHARSIYDGEVSAVFSMGGVTGVMVRHGSYISVYCNLSSVSVRKGQHVSARQTLGTVGQDNILQFQLRKERAKLNPESWLGR